MYVHIDKTSNDPTWLGKNNRDKKKTEFWGDIGLLGGHKYMYLFLCIEIKGRTQTEHVTCQTSKKINKKRWLRYNSVGKAPSYFSRAAKLQ